MLVLCLLIPLLACIAASDDNVVCPDGKSMCLNQETCCIMASGEYGCCPLPQAVCCTDKVHCCPTNYVCNLLTVTCDRQGRKIPMLKHKEATLFVENRGINTYPVVTQLPVKHVICPGGRSYCNDDSTCCLVGTGEYACCPMKNAVCCKDDVHCCPNGYKCDTGTGGCIMSDQKVPFQLKSPAKRIGSSNVICPSGSECPFGSTCCAVGDGEYGCCPMPHAVCCADNEHCCPHHFKCVVKESKCTLGDLSVPMLRKTQPVKKSSHPSRKGLTSFNATDGSSLSWADKQEAMQVHINLKAVRCPDGISQCPTGSTCCVLKSGMYGCCPYSNAVCCMDHVHCCPGGTRCDVTSGMCLRGKEKALVKINQNQPKYVIKADFLNDNVCPDKVSVCPSGSTCCKLAAGGYGCCPLPKAVCCSDGKHCCPHGTTCDLSSGKCLRGSVSMNMMKKVAATPLTDNGVCPDGISSCPSGSTCCKLAAGGYGCCPFPKAVCCSDGQHCCPNGYECGIGGYCARGSLKQEASKHTAATSLLSAPLADSSEERAITCPDMKTKCISGTSCCQNKDSVSYSCCPIKNAVCCGDYVHCCPNGWSCDVAQGTCRHKKTADQIALLKKFPGKRSAKVHQEMKNQDPYIRF